MNNQMRFYVRKLALTYYNFRYSKYYPVALPLIITSLGLVILVLLIIPQLKNWFSVQEEIEATQARINIMRQNSRILESFDKASVDRDFIVATEALPSDKNFAGILNAISNAALASNVSLNDYEFSLGAVSTSKNGKKVSPVSEPIAINVDIEGNINDVSNFIEEIEKKIPIAEIKNINYSERGGEVILKFYIKTLPDLNIEYSDPITSMTQDQRSILQVLSQWSTQ